MKWTQIIASVSFLFLFITNFQNSLPQFARKPGKSVANRFNLENWPNKPIYFNDKISRYNANYFCKVTKIVFSPNSLTLHIDERGNNTLGAIQNPRASKLTSDTVSFPLLRSEFTIADSKRQYLGYLIYDTSKLQKGMKVYFEYGESGYSKIHLFTFNDEFIQQQNLYAIVHYDLIKKQTEQLEKECNQLRLELKKQIESEAALKLKIEQLENERNQLYKSASQKTNTAENSIFSNNLESSPPEVLPLRQFQQKYQEKFQHIQKLLFADVEVLMNENDKLKQHTENLNTERNQLRKECEQLRHEIEVHVNDKKTMKQHIENLDAEKSQLQRECEKLRHEIEAHLEDRQKLQQQIKQGDRERNLLQNECNNLRHQIEVCTLENEKLKQNGVQLENERSQLQKECEQLRGKVERLTESEKKLTQRAEQLEADCKQYTLSRLMSLDEIKALEARLESLLKETRNLKEDKLTEISKKDSECIVCMERPRSRVFIPCGHVCLCEFCAPALKKCPVCRKEGNAMPFYNP